MSCPDKDILMKFFLGETEENELSIMMKHLDECEKCRKEIENLSFMKEKIISEGEPDIPKSFLHKYHRKLGEIFNYRHILIDSVTVKVLKYAAILIIGVVIGQYVRVMNQSSGNIATESTVSESHTYFTNLASIHNYLQQMEMFLLEVENTDFSTTAHEVALMSMENETLEELLNKTKEIKSSIGVTKKEFHDFLKSLEVTLSQISNSEVSKKVLTLRKLQENIKREQLIRELVKYKNQYFISRM